MPIKLFSMGTTHFSNYESADESERYTNRLAELRERRQREEVANERSRLFLAWRKYVDGSRF
jgi:hypothetical protein